MKNCLMLVGKDVDAYLAEHINKNHHEKLNIDLVVLKHRDYDEFNELFKNVKNIYSLPEFAYKNEDKYNALNIVEIMSLLESYEKKYSLRRVNRYIHYDFFRAISKDTSHKENLLRILTIIEFFESIEIEAYDFSFGELSRSFYLVCYDIMHSLNKPYLSPVNVGGFKGITYVDDKFQIINFEKKKKSFFNDINNEKYYEEARDYLEAFRNKPKYQYTFLENNFSNMISKLKHLVRKSKNIFKEVKAFKIDKKHRFDYIYQSPFRRVFEREVMPIIKRKIINFLYFKKKLLNNDSAYIYFPLHVVPETTTSLFSEFSLDLVSNQASTIDYLSKMIPTRNTLIVKEHPAMIGLRDTKFYKDYDLYYNVELVGPQISQFDILDKSDYVVTLCGTVGIEALMYGKKVIVHGNAYYGYFRGIVKTNSFQDIHDAFNEDTKFDFTDETLIEDLAFLIYCVHKNVFNFLIDNNPKAIEEENLELFAKSIFKELDLDSKSDDI